ncbi:hypothetical protein DOS74_03140 [Staphylococcus felis]|uniref:Uncharacterized protein n=1 Tax=Staphylococcus felis TaxID=46127 RepID=A0A3E0IKN3_9STAP|nr:hypothetical protein [Staphylococcus felis]REH82324.1 hypothetical protein DOS61_09720 [Staphylococcus felis]REH88646.1 hypothetical protein DOS83_14020 [Staphylococcus felis]REH92863.1 hypothetical protein DOS58_00405 [Staphylococcus felis]REI17215.1 hypothetical protein DOS75_05525 [Staphylococcus felis]REI17867.1 hypothetical protein DOS74_03140 [Staphylococcus felis]
MGLPIEIVLDRNQIEAILNGERIEYDVDNIKISIRESYVLPLSAPLIERPIKVVNTNDNVVVNKRYYNHLQNITLSNANN